MAHRLQSIGAAKIVGGLLALAAGACLQGGEQEFIFGACTHRWQEPDMLQTIKQAGITSNRNEISWAGCEKVKGVIEASGRRPAVDASQPGQLRLESVEGQMAK